MVIHGMKTAGSDRAVEGTASQLQITATWLRLYRRSYLIQWRTEGGGVHPLRPPKF
jgi:hypothetical protein